MSAPSYGNVAAELELIRKLAFSTFGLDLRGGKEELIMARVGKVMRARQLGTIREYYDYVVADRSGAALSEMVDALTTNFTSFFREATHFDLLRKTILPECRQKRVRIWSAACSTGEEPYSVAFCLQDAGMDSNGANVLATDISGKVLNQASAAMYKDEALKGISQEERKRYFLEGIGAKAGWFKVKPEIRRRVQFSQHNLLETLAAKEEFDVIFCRNVMIYFNRDTQQTVVNNLVRNLRPGGYLLIGHSETLNNVQHSLRYVAPAVYRSTT